jgi:hypothetical protein
MDAVIGVRRLGNGTVELVRRIWHVTIRGPLVRLAGPPPAQGLVGVVQAAPHSRKALVSSLIEAALGLGPPQPMLLGDQFLDLIQDMVFVHMPSLLRSQRGRAGRGRVTSPSASAHSIVRRNMSGAGV